MVLAQITRRTRRCGFTRKGCARVVEPSPAASPGCFEPAQPASPGCLGPARTDAPGLGLAVQDRCARTGPLEPVSNSGGAGGESQVLTR